MRQHAESELFTLPSNHSRHGYTSLSLYRLEHCFSSFWNDTPF